MIECEYKYGKFDGKYMKWNKNGIKNVECEYKDGKKLYRMKKK
jgi:antitoxin component YwqK of YwqJK toxin-antitoxin module